MTVFPSCIGSMLATAFVLAGRRLLAYYSKSRRSVTYLLLKIGILEMGRGPVC
jgi:hypothetical protein